MPIQFKCIAHITSKTAFPILLSIFKHPESMDNKILSNIISKLNKRDYILDNCKIIGFETYLIGILIMIFLLGN